MNSFKTIIALHAACFCMNTTAQVNIGVDVAQKGIEISPTLYGIFYEDINFASDGGLYAELIANRSFEEFAQGEGFTLLSCWRYKGADIDTVRSNLLNEKQGHALKVKTTDAGGGISNIGYWGINTVAGTQYKLSFWVTPLQLPRGGEIPMRASLRSKDGKILGETLIKIQNSKGDQ